LASELSASRTEHSCNVPILRTIATKGDGVEELFERARALLSSTESDKLERRGAFIERWLRESVARALLDDVEPEVWAEAVRNVLGRSHDPFTAAEKIIEQLKKV
jgi:putative protein kinase ArgK-like GTPase of G3E family